jgi:hypothetical protein
MSKQLTLSATLSVVATGAMALALTLGAPSGGGDAKRAATAHGSIASVLLAL